MSSTASRIHVDVRCRSGRPRRIIGVVLLAFILAGCAATAPVPSDARKGVHGTRWTKADTSEQVFAREHYVCMRDATVPTQSGPFGVFGGGAHTDRELYIACMKAQGYQQIGR